MKPLLSVVAAALVLVAPAAGGKSPSRAQVVAKEFSFSISRKNIKPGEMVIELANFGADPHDLTVKRVKGGAVVGGLPQVLGGSRGELTITLKAGKYELYCSLADHEALGMKVFLNVRKPEPPPE